MLYFSIMKVRQARKVLKNNGILWTNIQDLIPLEFNNKLSFEVRQAITRMIKFIYNGRTGEE